MVTVADNEVIRIDRFELGPFGTNSYVLICSKTSESVVIDAPSDSGMILDALEQTYPKYILITHHHFDHVSGLSELKSALGVPIAAHPSDASNLPVVADILLGDGDEIAFGDIRLEVLHTPGHTPGSLCFRTSKYLIAGDTLFPGGPGHTQSPADFHQIIASITGKIFRLSDDTPVFPGHGESTTVGRAKELFEVFSSKGHDPNLCGDVEWETS